MQRALTQQLLGKKARRELLAFLDAQLPRLGAPPARNAWLDQAAKTRQQLLELFFRGHDPSLLAAPPRVEWRGVIETGKGYRIRKLRYEGYPGMWVPALLYEPDKLRGRVPAVLNPNGHHPGGKAMDYKQARCLNLAKRGVLALSTEFIGMGELRADADHNRIGLLDLCGVAGIGVFYLLIKRSLDVLLAHAHTDPERVAVTGLSGGGWQTALLSALDERVRAIAPVAGYTPVWQRTGCIEDIGDLEQVPADLGTIADFDTLTALFAPRPTLLTYNRFDDCCFQTRRARKSVYEPAKPYFALLNAADQLAFHDNVDPGTHNYEADNRSQFYQFLNRHFGLNTPAGDLPWKEELRSEAELSAGLPEDNATLLSLAQQALKQVRAARARRKPLAPAKARKRLRELLCLPAFTRAALQKSRPARPSGGVQIHQHLLCLDGTWTLPVTELIPAGARGAELILADGGRRSAARLVALALASGRRVLVADVFGTGENTCIWQHHMLISTAGQRSLGIQVGQVLALLAWAGRRCRQPALHLRATGQVMPVVALLATALEPARVKTLTTASLIDSLGRLIAWPVAYASAAPLFCFGLLREFDLPDLVELCAPVPIHDSNRGPLRANKPR
ncbi:MAG: acetylxylan esterase [Candidatus Latescibacteria bacterium]|nr:acetylxylan esterase [Candidatus Latescibacterota bacterium]